MILIMRGSRFKNWWRIIFKIRL